MTAHRKRRTGRHDGPRARTGRWRQAGELIALALKILTWAVALVGTLTSGDGCGRP